ncbi:MAG: hypothetical protein QOF24_74 [Verrucomicrobiota bacterium]|jgi:hypothetical protein
MNLQLKLVFIATILAGTWLTAGCSKSSKDSLIGKWTKVTATRDDQRPGVANTAQGSSIEFVEGGTFILGGNQSTTYKVLAKDRISIGGYGGVGILYEFAVDGDQLTLKEEVHGTPVVWVYKRVGLNPSNGDSAAARARGENDPFSGPRRTNPINGMWSKETGPVDVSRPGLASVPQRAMTFFGTDGAITGTDAKYAVIDDRRMVIEDRGKRVFYTSTRDGDKLSFSEEGTSFTWLFINP